MRLEWEESVNGMNRGEEEICLDMHIPGVFFMELAYRLALIFTVNIEWFKKADFGQFKN